MLFRYRKSTPLQAPVVAWVAAASVIAGVSIAAASLAGSGSLLFGLPLAAACAAIAAAIAVVRGRLVGLEVDRDALRWRMRRGRGREVPWSAVRRVVVLTSRGGDAGIQLVTDNASLVIRLADFDDPHKLSAALQLRDALTERRTAERDASPSAAASQRPE